MTHRVTTELKRLAALHDTDRLARMTPGDLAAELEDIANRYLDLADCLVELRAAPRGTHGKVEQERVTFIRARPALVQS